MNNTKRKVLVISGAFPPVRIAEADHVLHICRKLAERDFAVEILTGRNSVRAGMPARIHPVMSKWSWFELARLLTVAARSSPDVVFLWFIGHAYDFHPMVTFAPTALKRMLRKVPIVTQITLPVGYWPQRQLLLTRLIRKAAAMAAGSAGVDYSFGTLLRDSDHIIMMATTHLKAVEQKWPQVITKSTVIPPPPLLPMSPASPETRRRGRMALGLASEEFVFAYFGRLYRGKGLETLFEAFQRLGNHSNVKLAIIGGATDDSSYDDWRVEHLHELARRLDIEDRIVWSGEYPWDSDLGSTYLRAADCAILPFDQGIDLNNSSFAAVAAHGLPTITTRGAVLEGPFVDGENVRLCPPREPIAMASAMEELLAKSELRQRLRSGIEVLANDWFSWEVSVERTIAAFDCAAAARCAKPVMPTRFQA